MKIVFISSFTQFVFEKKKKKKNIIRVKVLNLKTSRTLFEPPHGKTKNLHMRNQRRRSASR